jgi:hypothetical protein
MILAIIALCVGVYPFPPDKYTWRNGFFYASWLCFILYEYALHGH